MTTTQLNKPKILSFNKNSVTINWEHLRNKDQDGNRFVLQKLDDFKEWQTIYRGKKLEYKITNLAPCTAYKLRLKSTKQWVNFTIATQIERYFIQHLTRAIKFNKLPLLRRVLSQQSNLLEIPDINNCNKTPLVQAIELGDVNLIDLLIKNGIDINAKSLIKQSTPLMLAIYEGQLKIASLLIAKGANLDEIDRNGLNVLHYAVDSNNWRNVEFCLQQQIDVNCKDCSGWTPLIRGCILKIDRKILELLLENGADPSIKDNNGYDYYKYREICV